MPLVPDVRFPRQADRRRHWLHFLACCFVAICSFRAFLVETFAASIAWGDDLEGIAFQILAPWSAGTLSPGALFAAHNGDHRIVVTRLWEILWFELNGSWDPKLVMVAKCAVYAAAATIFIHLLAGRLERRRFVAGAALAALFAFPFAYHNLIWAFQSQFDFFLLAAALGWLALLHGRLVLAFAAAAVALVTLGAGPLVAASYVPYLLAMGATRHWPRRRVLACLATALVLTLIGLSLRTSDRLTPSGDTVDKLITFTRLYAWPFSNLFSIVERLPESGRYIPDAVLNFPSPETNWLLAFAASVRAHPVAAVAVHITAAAFMLAPTLGVIGLVARRQLPVNIARGPLCLAGFACLLLVATATARTDQVTIGVRYLDLVLLAGATSLVACFVLTRTHRRLPRAVLLWLLLAGAGYTATSVVTFAQLNRRAPDASLALLQRYYEKNDHAVLRDHDAYRTFIVGSDPTNFLRMLDHPAMRPVLPLAVTQPTASRGNLAAVASHVAHLGLLFAFTASATAAWVIYRSQRPRTSATSPAVPAPARA